MAPIARTVAALALLLPAALAAQPKPQAQPKAQTSLRVPGTSAAVPVMQMMIVPVPVVEVVVVAGAWGKEGDAALQNSTEKKIEEKCIGEMKTLMQDQKRMEKSQECEKTTGHAQSAIKQLELADASGAQGNVEKLFTECAQLSQECAKQMAPDVVLKMRLSGVAITDQCITTGKTIMNSKLSDSEMACQKKTVKGMAEGLMAKNMDGALVAAQGGLKECHKVEHPCDFQLAPIMVMNLLQEAQGAAQEPEPEPEMEMPEISLGLLAKAQATKKMTLLDVATRVRVTSRSLTLRA